MGIWKEGKPSGRAVVHLEVAHINPTLLHFEAVQSLVLLWDLLLFAYLLAILYSIDGPSIFPPSSRNSLPLTSGCRMCLGTPSEQTPYPGDRITPVIEDTPALTADPESYDPEEAWKKQNLLSLGQASLYIGYLAFLTHCVIDGGGIRGLWTLLTIQRLMTYIGELEESVIEHSTNGNTACSSFSPHPYPQNATHVRGKNRQGPGCRYCDTPLAGRYLPCHYFDTICGTSTGA